MLDFELPRIVVVGSINMDLVASCKTLPREGQTLTAKSFAEIPGGKGANQAVAASRAGARVSMIGRVGEDAFGEQLVADLASDQIDVSSVQRTSGPSGIALIVVADDGENQIVVVPGANGVLSTADVDQFESVIADADVLLLQLEVPLPCVLRAIEAARNAGTRVILDPAPVPSDYPGELFNVDLLCPNETEAATMTGLPVETPEQIEQAARMLHARGCRNVAITLGAKGTLLFDGNTMEMVDPFPTKAVDTTAAGDSFAGAVSVWWAQTNSLIQAVRFGNAAGSIAASRAGAKPSLPNRSEIESLAAE